MLKMCKSAVTIDTSLNRSSLQVGIIKQRFRIGIKGDCIFLQLLILYYTIVRNDPNSYVYYLLP